MATLKITVDELHEYIWKLIKEADVENYYCSRDDENSSVIMLYSFDVRKFAEAILKKVE